MHICHRVWSISVGTTAGNLFERLSVRTLSKRDEVVIVTSCSMMDHGTAKKIHKRRRINNDEDNHIDHEVDGASLNDDEESRLKKKAAEKVKKNFSVALVGHAVSCDWEDHDLARLVILISKERQLNSKKTLQLLQRCSICTPVVLTTLQDADFEFSCTEMIGAMYDQAQHVDRFIQVIEDSFEQDMLNLKDMETLTALFDTAESSMNVLQFRRFARVLCDHSKTKMLCGRVLNLFACRMSASEACSFICDIVSYDFFMDLTGDMEKFYKEMPDVADDVQSLLSSTRDMDSDGNLIDSDEDESGNLRGFIDDDMGDEYTGHIKEEKNKRIKKKKHIEESCEDSNSDDADDNDFNDLNRKSGASRAYDNSNYVDYGSEDSADFSGTENSDVEDEDEDEDGEGEEEEEGEGEVEKGNEIILFGDEGEEEVEVGMDYEIDIASGSDSPDTEPEEDEEDDNDSDDDDDNNDNNKNDRAALQLLATIKSKPKSKSKSTTIIAATTATTATTQNKSETQIKVEVKLEEEIVPKLPMSKNALKRLRRRNRSENIMIESTENVPHDIPSDINVNIPSVHVKSEEMESGSNESELNAASSAVVKESESKTKGKISSAAAIQRNRRVIDDDNE